MPRIIVFDVNETLLDLKALDPPFERVFGSAGVRRDWFKQVLQSALLTTILDACSDFGAVGAAALEMMAAVHDVRLTDDDRKAILGTMREMPPHPEVAASLGRLREAGLRIAALTNSTRAVAEAQLEHAGLTSHFERILSADAVRRLKPHAEVYRMAARECGVEPGEIRLVAAHSWDVAGALRAGCAAAFVARAGMTLDPLFEPPDVVAPDLAAVAERILAIEPPQSGWRYCTAGQLLGPLNWLSSPTEAHVDKSFDLVVVGTGAAANAVGSRCRAAGWSVAIIDELPFGGTCQLRGCDPKKVLRRAAEVVDATRLMRSKGVHDPGLSIDWPALMAFKRSFTDPVPANREKAFAEAGVDAFKGTARFTDEATLIVGDDRLRARHVVIASGAKPVPLPIKGAEHVVTSGRFLELEHLPARVLFIGGGYISFEFAHIAARADARVIILDRGERPLKALIQSSWLDSWSGRADWA